MKGVEAKIPKIIAQASPLNIGSGVITMLPTFVLPTVSSIGWNRTAPDSSSTSQSGLPAARVFRTKSIRIIILGSDEPYRDSPQFMALRSVQNGKRNSLPESSKTNRTQVRSPPRYRRNADYRSRICLRNTYHRHGGGRYVTFQHGVMDLLHLCGGGNHFAVYPSDSNCSIIFRESSGFATFRVVMLFSHFSSISFMLFRTSVSRSARFVFSAGSSTRL